VERGGECREERGVVDVVTVVQLRLLESRDLLGVCYRLRKLPKAKPELS